MRGRGGEREGGKKTRGTTSLSSRFSKGQPKRGETKEKGHQFRMSLICLEGETEETKKGGLNGKVKRIMRRKNEPYNAF